MSEEKKYLVSLDELNEYKGNSFRTMLQVKDFLESHEYKERTCNNTDNRGMRFVCSVCGYAVVHDLYAEEFAYCPNCAAKVVQE